MLRGLEIVCESLKVEYAGNEVFSHMVVHVNGVNDLTDNIRGYSERYGTPCETKIWEFHKVFERKKVVEMSGIEPLTYTLRTYRSPN